MLYAYSKTTGLLYWSKNVKQTYFSEAKFSSTLIFFDSTPAKYLDTFLMGVYQYGYVVRIQISTGNLIGKVIINSHSLARISQSGTVFGNTFYVGASSKEESAAATATYPCCSFAGTFVAIDIPTMTLIWTWNAIPPSLVGLNKFAGAAIWGSSPAIDTVGGIVYFGTGNNYYVPATLQACYNKNTKANWETACNQVLAPDNWFESVVALNIKTGTKIWAHRFTGQDAWTDACNTKGNPNCPFAQGINPPDADFDMAPTLSNINGVKVLFIGQKSGVVYCLNAATGTIIWQTAILVTTFGALSVDETHVYVNVPNIGSRPWVLLNKLTTTGGGWVALDKKTGLIVWTTANPNIFVPYKAQNGPITVAGDIVLAASYDGYVYTLSKATGKVVSSYNTKSQSSGGFSADGTCAFLGNNANTVLGFCTK